MPELRIIRAVVDEIDTLNLPPDARVLDLSCGEGEIIEHLTAKGLQVEGTHYCEKDYIIRNPSPVLQQAVIHAPVDLTQPLPFPDESFDLVLATEVLEHLPSHAPVVQEIARILKPGGHFLFTTPNPHRTLSRIQFLFTGTHNLNGARLGWQTPKAELYSTHFNPVYLPVIHTLLYQSGLQVKRIGATSIRIAAVLVTLLLWPWCVLPVLFETRHFRKRSAEGGRDLQKWLLCPNLFLSRQLLVVSTKENLR
jgi:SAM-dependent methyltransferase